MSTPSDQIEAFAETVDQAARTAKAIPQFPADAFDVETAYQIQAASVARRIERHEFQTGIKMGFTSLAKMEQMGVNDMIWGRLTDDMMITEGGITDMSRYIHPRVEPEVAFLLGEDLAGDLSIPEAMAAVEAVAPALEVIDSRYENFKFSLADVIADNTSAAGYVLGNWMSPEVSLENLGIIMSINGRMRQCGSTSAILGSPYRSLVHAARLADLAGEPLEAGWIVLAGAATASEFMQPGDKIHAEFQNLSSVSFSIE